MFMSLFVIYGFDTASTLAEETKDPRREAPKAVLSSIVGAFIIGAIFLWGTLMAIPDLKEAHRQGGMRTGADHRGELLRRSATVYLLVVVGRHLRLLHVDHDLDRPAGVRHGPGQPTAAVQAAGQGEPDAAHADVGLRRGRRSCRRSRSCSSRARPIIAIAATAMIYLSYLLGNIAMLRARLAGGRGPRRPSAWARGAPSSTSWRSSGGARCWSTSATRACAVIPGRSRPCRAMSNCSTSTPDS